MNLTSTDYAALSPFLIVLFASLIMLLLESFSEKASRLLALPLTSVALMIALFATVVAPLSSHPLLTPWLSFTHLSAAFNFIFILIGLCVALLSAPFFQHVKATHGEYFFLLLASVFGLMLIGSSADFLTLFLGLETLSLSLYVWCGYVKGWKFSHESALKYFLMGAIATAFLVYGIALIYGAVGTTSFYGLLANYHAISEQSVRLLFLSGIAMVTLALAFKAAIVPFHVWAPDVYDGAPTPVVAFMAVGTKIGAFVAFIIIFLQVLRQFDPIWNEAIALLAYPTLIYANFVALKQTQLRRFFAYSGISHAGFLLIPLAAGGPDAVGSLFFYMIVYALATLGAFAVLVILDQRSEGVTFEDLRGLFRRAPYLAGLLAFCLLTLAGIPPTPGFIAKFFIFKVAFQAGYSWLVIVGLLTSILAAYYYLRIIAIMFSDAPAEEKAPPQSWPAFAVGVMALTMLVILTIFPGLLMPY